MKDRKILTINDSIHGMIELTSLEKEIISSSLFNRLHDISQNSSVYLTFPTNRTKRFEHSIGVMHLCGEMLFNSLNNTYIYDECEGHPRYNEFLKVVEKSIKEIISELRNASNSSPIAQKIRTRSTLDSENLNDLENEYLNDGHINKRIMLLDENNKIVLSIIYQSARISALLHDLGHPPFSHITEKALERIHEYTKEISNPRVDDFKKIYERMKNGNIKELHEAIGDGLVDNIFNEIVEPGETSETKYLCVIWSCVKKILTNEGIWKSIHLLIDNDVDCDRLDYIVRDNNASGIKGYELDYQRIISSMQLRKDENGNYVFAFVAKSCNSLEDLFLKRLELYKNIIFHHRVVKTDFIFRDIIEKLGKKYLSEVIVSSDSKQNETGILLTDISFLWYALEYVGNSSQDAQNSLLQWDDSWLLSILKIERNKLKRIKEKSLEDEILLDELNEVLCGEKYYFSAIKRNYDFRIIDEACKKELSKNKSNFIEANKNDDFKQKMKDINIYVPQPKYFILNVVYKILDECSEKGELIKNFIKIVDDSAKETMEYYNDHVENHINDVFADVKKLKSLKKGVYLYRPHNAEAKLLKFEEQSNIKAMLEAINLNSPCIYVYIKKKSEIQKKIKDERFLKKFGEILGKKIAVLLAQKEIKSKIKNILALLLD